jgi:TP901 family phage tail tape measure protein
MSLRAGAAYIDIHGRLARDFDRNIEKEGSSRLGGVGSKLGGVIAGGMATAGVVAGAALAKGLSDAISNEQVGDRLSAQLGVTGENAEFFGKVAGDLYTNAWGDSLAATGDAVKKVWQNGLVPEDVGEADFERITALALDFTSTFEQDMDQTTAAVGQMLRTGVAGSAEEAFDLLTRGAQQGADKAGDMAEVFNEYGTQFRQLGLSGADAMGLLAQGVKGGARDADIVADSLKEFAIRAQDGSKTTEDGFHAMGLSADRMAASIAKGGPEAAAALDETLDKLREIKDPALQAQTATALFGTQAEDLQDALYALDPSSAAKGLGEVEGAAQKMSDTLNDNLGTRLESLKRRGLAALAGFVGDKVIPAVEALAPVVERGVNTIVAKWPAVQQAIEPVVQRIVALVTEKWPKIQETIDRVLAAITLTIDSFVATATILWDRFGGYILENAKMYLDAISRQFSAWIDMLLGLVDLFVAVFTGDWAAAWEAAKAVLSAAWQGIVGIFEAGFAVVRLVLQIGLDLLAAVFSAAWEAITAGVSSAFDSMIEFFASLPGRMASAAGDVFGFLWDSFKSVVNHIIRSWNRLEFKLPGFDPPGPGPKFKGFTLGVPDIAELRARGGSMLPGNLYLTSEEGPELLRMGSIGGRMFPHDELAQAMSGGSSPGAGGNAYEVHIYNPEPEPASDSIAALRRTALELS